MCGCWLWLLILFGINAIWTAVVIYYMLKHIKEDYYFDEEENGDLPEDEC